MSLDSEKKALKECFQRAEVSWKKLQKHYDEDLAAKKVKELFDEDPKRFERFHVSFEEILFDFSKNIVEEETLSLLFKLCEDMDVAGWRNRMFSGDLINFTEQRAVLHVALRNVVPLSSETAPLDSPVPAAVPAAGAAAQQAQYATPLLSRRRLSLTFVDAPDLAASSGGSFSVQDEFDPPREYRVHGKDVMPDVRKVLAQMRKFSEEVRSGEYRSCAGEAFTDVVNIGIGGSNLGPAMVCEALRAFWGPVTPHFVSNVDGTHIRETLMNLDPARTLFIISSKTFTTQETMKNAHTARRWFLNDGHFFQELVNPRTYADVAKNFVAVSANIEEVVAFGIARENTFPFWDWVGGRYSVWSAIGLPVCLAVGYDLFHEMLCGARAMDEHFLKATFRENIPVIMACLGIWYRNTMGAQSHAILPYDQYLSLFAKYFQQGDMESNGKSATRFGDAVARGTGPIVWGEPGTDGQHAVFQLIHQGSTLIPCDFLAPVFSRNPIGNHHAILLSNFFAQTEALMVGRSRGEIEADLRKKGFKEEDIERTAPQLVMPGNRPSNSLLFNKMTPRTLGSLMAAYEHKIFVQGVVWGINSFDQPGVELGKVLARKILPELEGGKADPPVSSHDASTNGLINHARSVIIAAERKEAVLHSAADVISV